MKFGLRPNLDDSWLGVLLGERGPEAIPPVLGLFPDELLDDLDASVFAARLDLDLVLDVEVLRVVVAIGYREAV